MAMNEVFRDARHLSLPVTGKKAGDPVRIEELNGVLMTNPGEGCNPEGYASVWLEGAFRLEVEEAITAVGKPIYIKSNGKLTVTKGSDALFGIALEKTTGKGLAAIKVVQAVKA